MNWFVSFYIGLRYWHSKKSERFTSFILFFSVTGIVLGVASLILVSSIMNGLEGKQKEKTRKTVEKKSGKKSQKSY